MSVPHRLFTEVIPGMCIRTEKNSWFQHLMNGLRFAAHVCTSESIPDNPLFLRCHRLPHTHDCPCLIGIFEILQLI